MSASSKSASLPLFINISCMKMNERISDFFRKKNFDILLPITCKESNSADL